MLLKTPGAKPGNEENALELQHCNPLLQFCKGKTVEVKETLFHGRKHSLRGNILSLG